MNLSFILDVRPNTLMPVAVNPEDSIQHAIDLLCAQDIGALIVLAADSRRLVGILSDRDILQAMCSQDPRDFSTLQVRDLMSRDVITVFPGEEAHHALALMTEHHISHLPVIKDAEVVGMVSQRDILRELQEASEVQVHSLSDYLGGTYGSRVF